MLTLNELKKYIINDLQIDENEFNTELEVAADIFSEHVLHVNDLIDYLEEHDGELPSSEDVYKMIDIDVTKDILYDIFKSLAYNNNASFKYEKNDMPVDDFIKYNKQIIDSKVKRALRLYKFDNTDEKENPIMHPSALINNGDNIGDDIPITKSFDVDWAVRDYPFLYFDGKIIIGDKNDIHSDILQRELNINKVYEPQVRYIEDMPDVDNNTSIAFGHIYKNMAFIETCENCNADDVKNALQGTQKFDKIYDYQITSHNLQRLAKKLVK